MMDERFDGERRGPRGIGWAVMALVAGYRVRRRDWNGKGMFLVLVEAHQWHCALPLAGADFDLSSFVAMKTADGMLVPWLCSQSDLLALDWELADDEKGGGERRE